MVQTQKPGPQKPAAHQQAQNAAQMNLPKILRIGIVQSGKIVEERLVRKRENVTIGPSAKNTFVVMSTALPRSFTIFELTPSGYALNFTDGMDGRIAFDQNVPPVTLAQLRQKAQKRGDHLQAVLNERARGKIVINDVTILFQFVHPPPVQARPQLPPSVRGSITQNLDWMMVGIVAASFVAHIAFVAYLRQVDWPRKPDIEEIPDRFVPMIVPKKEEKKKEEKVDPNANKQAETKVEKKGKGDDRPKGPAKPRDPEAEARAAAERRARLAKEVQSMGVLKILGAKGEDGTIADLVKGGDPGGDADKVFAQVGGVGVAGAGQGGGLRSAKGAGGTGTAKGIGGLRASGPGDVGTGEKGGEREAKMKGSVKDSAPVDIDGSLDPNVVANTIRSRKGAVIACYEKALKRNPSLAGKITLRFTISSIGKVTAADIDSNSLGDDEVGQCMTTIVKTWRFPAPAGGEVQFSYPFIFQASK
jgi:TonB family protein